MHLFISTIISQLFFEDVSVWHLSVIATSCCHCRMSNKIWQTSESIEAAVFVYIGLFSDSSGQSAVKPAGKQEFKFTSRKPSYWTLTTFSTPRTTLNGTMWCWWFSMLWCHWCFNKEVLLRVFRSSLCSFTGECPSLLFSVFDTVIALWPTGWRIH